MRRTESAIQKQIINALRLGLPSRAIVAAIPNGGKRGKIEASIMKAEGVLAGMPDIIVLLDGTAYGIEVKSPKGRLSEAQEAMAERFAGNDLPWTVARSVDDVAAFFDHYGYTLRARLS